jgi:hypothetical protein
VNLGIWFQPKAGKKGGPPRMQAAVVPPNRFALFRFQHLLL